MGERCEVVVIGARLAGSAAASHLARAGARVIVLDHSRFPSDRLSTHLLFPSGVDELRRMGALDGVLALDPARSSWLSLQADGEVRLFERWRPYGPIDYCLCVPRHLQDLELVRAARASGVEVRERCKVLDVLWRGGRARGVRYRDAAGRERELLADLVVGADGRRSTVADRVGVFHGSGCSEPGTTRVDRNRRPPRTARATSRRTSHCRNRTRWTRSRTCTGSPH